MLSYPYDFSGGSDGKASAYNAGDPGSIPALGREDLLEIVLFLLITELRSTNIMIE